MDHREEDDDDRQQQLCDDGSILISACQSFFGQYDVVHEPPKVYIINNGCSEGVVSSPSEEEQPLSSSSTNRQQQQLSSALSSQSMPLPSSSSLSTNNGLFSNDNNSHLLLSSRARSMSPSLNTTTSSHHSDHQAALCDPTTWEEGGEDYWTTSGYFETSDFATQTWLNVLQENDTFHYSVGGAAIVTAVIVMHPLVLMGAATAAVGASAAWAVGRFHDLDTGYQIWNHDDFGMLFWEEQTEALLDDYCWKNDDAIANANNDTAVAIATWGSQQIIQPNEEGLRREYLNKQEQEREETKVSDFDVTKASGGDGIPLQQQQQQQQQQTSVEKKIQSISLDETNRLIRVNSAPVKESSSSSQSPDIKSRSSRQSPQHHLLPPRLQNKATQHPTTLPPSILSTQQSLDRHYPPLKNRVVNQVEFHGLNTCEFFQVFFGDDAPYSMKDFQQKRGDVDVSYGMWEDVVDIQNLSSFQPGLLPLPSNSTRERTLTFNTLARSYFGPAYAKATKIQRATQLSKHLLVIENQTHLAEVPFAERFKVLERWVIEAVKKSSKNDSGGEISGGGVYTCKLTVHAEVIMLSPCKFEPQIRKKAAEAFTDLTTEWCKLATKALEATKEQKRKRMRHKQQHHEQQLFGEEDKRIRLGGTTESELFAKHQKKFQELDDLVSHGDSGIEVMHSIKAGEQCAYAEVLEPQPSSSGLLKLRDGTVVEVAPRRRRGSASFSRIPSKIKRKFSSRGSFSKNAR